MNLNENINRIKQMMGLLNEQGVSSEIVVQKIINNEKLTKEELNVKGDLSFFGNTSLKSLPKGLKVEGRLILVNCTSLKYLPEGLEVGGYLWMDNTKIVSLPKGLKVGEGIGLRNCTSLQYLPKGLKVVGSLDLRNCTSLQYLPEGLEVGDYLLLEDCKNLKYLPKGLKVGESLDLRNCTSLKYLPEGLKVEGYLYLTNTPLSKLSNSDLVKMIGPDGYVKKGVYRNDNQEPEELLQPSPTSINQTQPTPVPPQQTYNYPDINKNPFKPTNGDPWQYAYDGSKLLVKSPTTGNIFNLLDSNYFTTYPNSKLDTTAKLDKAKNEIIRLYGKELGL